MLGRKREKFTTCKKSEHWLVDKSQKRMKNERSSADLKQPPLKLMKICSTDCEFWETLTMNDGTLISFDVHQKLEASVRTQFNSKTVTH